LITPYDPVIVIGDGARVTHRQAEVNGIGLHVAELLRFLGGVGW
jgi:hypothetical protein